MSNSKKRSSPGADTTKNGDPLTEVDIGDAEESILAEYQKKIQRVELILGGYMSFCILRSHEHVVVVLIMNRLQSVVRRSN
jgi:hypothetical protein